MVSHCHTLTLSHCHTVKLPEKTSLSLLVGNVRNSTDFLYYSKETVINRICPFRLEIKNKNYFQSVVTSIISETPWYQEDVDMPHIVALPSSQYSIYQVN